MSLHCAAETYIKIKVPGADGAEGKAMSFMYFLAVLIGPLVKILYSFIGNYAATMIVATLILKLLLFPLSIHQQKSTAKMSVFQPLITEIQNFNTSFFGMDMCDVPGFHLTPIAIFPAIATVTMFVSYFITQKLSGMDAQMQGSMKVMMLVMNLMFVTFCFNAPVGFSLYYGVSNVVQIFQSYVTYKIYSPEKFKAQYEAELAAKRAEKKKKRTVTVEQNGKQVEKEVTLGEANKLRLEMARQREAELYKDERTTPLNKD